MIEQLKNNIERATVMVLEGLSEAAKMDMTIMGRMVLTQGCGNLKDNGSQYLYDIYEALSSVKDDSAIADICETMVKCFGNNGFDVAVLKAYCDHAQNPHHIAKKLRLDESLKSNGASFSVNESIATKTSNDVWTVRNPKGYTTEHEGYTYLSLYDGKTNFKFPASGGSITECRLPKHIAGFEQCARNISKIGTNVDTIVGSINISESVSLFPEFLSRFNDLLASGKAVRQADAQIIADMKVVSENLNNFCECDNIFVMENRLNGGRITIIADSFGKLYVETPNDNLQQIGVNECLDYISKSTGVDMTHRLKPFLIKENKDKVTCMEEEDIDKRIEEVKKKLEEGADKEKSELILSKLYEQKKKIAERCK